MTVGSVISSGEEIERTDGVVLMKLSNRSLVAYSELQPILMLLSALNALQVENSGSP